MEEEVYCVECGEPCDGSITNDCGEPLCQDCGDELGYTD